MKPDPRLDQKDCFGRRPAQLEQVRLLVNVVHVCETHSDQAACSVVLCAAAGRRTTTNSGTGVRTCKGGKERSWGGAWVLRTGNGNVDKHTFLLSLLLY